MSHYTLLVIGEGDLEDLLAPYDENMEITPYKAYWDTDDHKRWEQILRDPKNSSGGGYSGAKLLKGDGPSLEDVASAYNARYSEGNEDKVFVDDGGIYQWSTYNPQSKWDWWQLGGRWAGYFHAKPGASGEFGEPSWGGSSEDGDADAIRKGDIDVARMRNEAGDRAAKWWRQADELLGVFLPADSWETVLARHTDLDGTTDIEAARNDYADQPRVQAMKEKGQALVGMMDDGIDSYQLGLDEYVRQSRAAALAPYAYLLDGEWHAPGKMGWFGISSERDAERVRFYDEFNELFDALPDDTLLRLLDLHI